jgi:hypothetical protein
MNMAKRPKYQRSIRRGQIVDWPQNAESPEDLASRVTYTGNPMHKTYPSPAGQPAWRADKAKCDLYDRRDWPRLRDALQRAITARCVGQFQGDYPSRAWVWINNVLHEARLTGQGDYHAFPLNDPRQYPEPADRVENAPRVEIPVHPV